MFVICKNIVLLRKETKMMKPKKLLCFDLDGTLSQHKSHLPQENKDLLDGLCARYKVIMVGAGNAPLIYNQMEQYPVDIIGNYGMQESAIVDGEFKLIREDTVVFDPDRSKRRVLYDEICSLFPEHVVYIGGSSSFDFAPKQYNKYDSIMKYAEEHGYKEEEILFVGDDFGDGGGDSHVRIKGMDYVQIDDYRQLPETLSML